VNPKTNDGQDGEMPDGVPEPPKSKLSDVRVCTRPDETNGWYNPPDYEDMGDLSDDQAVIRMDYLKLQVGILQEAAEFESRESERSSLLATIRKYNEERDALGEHLCERIVQGDLFEARELSRQHKNTWNVRREGIDTKRQRSIVFDARTDKHTSQKECKRAEQIGGSPTGWSGVERRQSMSSVILVPPQANPNKKGARRPRTIEISVTL
jgi:hypothetical protein